jgi:small ligand-binding sensory domain FIST
MTSQFASARSNDPATFVAVDQVLSAVKQQLDGPAHVAVIFTTAQHAAALARIAPEICQQLGTENIIGCTAETVIQNEVECEGQPTFCLWAGRFATGSARLMTFEFENTPAGPIVHGIPTGLDPNEPGTLLLLAEPFSFPTDFLLEQLHASYPKLKVLGGMASAAHSPGQNRLIAGKQVLESGAVGLLLDANVNVQSVVSQGCRPIGQTWIITKADRNAILELGGKPALQQLQTTFAELSAADQALARRGVHVGRVMSEYREQFGPGDFLIRNVLGADPEQGAIVIGDYVRIGQTVQFQVRDAQTADQDLRELLQQAKTNGPASGALIFTCNGRGTRLFEQPHHDASCVQEIMGTIPTAGLFAAGEIGPVAGTNYLHGFTASIALFG